MDDIRAAPTLGIAASLAVVAVLAAPYAVVAEGSAVTTYYGAGSVNGLAVGLFALVALIVFAAGRERRTAPDTVAGVAIVLGGFMVALATLWAVTVPESLVTQLSTAALLQYHRAVLVLATLVVPVSAGWYARALGIF